MQPGHTVVPKMVEHAKQLLQLNHDMLLMSWKKIGILLCEGTSSMNASSSCTKSHYSQTNNSQKMLSCCAFLSRSLVEEKIDFFRAHFE